jgi:hypothetical protein
VPKSQKEVKLECGLKCGNESFNALQMEAASSSGMFISVYQSA